MWVIMFSSNYNLTGSRRFPSGRPVSFWSSLKLSPRFFGPYKVLACLGPVAYKLELPEGSQIYVVFHVSLLKPKFGPITPISQLPPLVLTDSVILP